jgi:DNA-binding NtrC family response regulator
MGHYWRGNVRELENTMHRAVLIAGPDEIGPEAIFLTGSTPSGTPAPTAPTQQTQPPASPPAPPAEPARQGTDPRDIARSNAAAAAYNPAYVNQAYRNSGAASGAYNQPASPGPSDQNGNAAASPAPATPPPGAEENAATDAMADTAQTGENAVISDNGSITAALVGRTVADVERELIIDTLKHCFGNRTHAANILGISIRTLRNKLRQYTDEGVDIPQPGNG